MSKDKRQSQLMPVVVLVLAWLVPGAGHICLNRVCRGIIIFLTVTATFWAGIAMGGVMTVDARNERWWFVAEMSAGVHGLIGWHRQQQVYRELNAGLADDPEYIHLARPHLGGRNPPALEALKDRFFDKMLQEKGLALASPMDTVARAYSGVAGLLNLMCVFDAVILALMGRAGEPPPPTADKQSTDE